MNKRWIAVSISFLCILSICAGCRLKNSANVQQEIQNDILAEENNYFDIIDKSTVDTQAYEYIVYTKSGEIARRETVSREPKICLLHNGLLEIATSHGSSAQLFQYYDVEKNLFSETAFWNRALVLEDGKIVYMTLDEENENVLVIQDIFDAEKYYKQVRRNFWPTAVPHLALDHAQVAENGELEITYYSGIDAHVEKERIPLQ